MIGLALTLDYEVYGDGEGSLSELAVEPTAKFLEICDEYNAKATIFVDVAEILAMRKIEVFKEDVLCAEEQLKFAHENGHDIQLHIHPWWLEAEFNNGKWEMDYKLSSLCHLNHKDALKYVQICKQYLTDLLEPCKRDYSCCAYRAGFWSMQPTESIFDALVKAEINIDSSVYKWGTLDTELMKFDYSNAYSNISPWFFRRENVNEKEQNTCNENKCLEIPIYAEQQRGLSFLSKKRLSLMPKIKSVMNDYSSNDKNGSYLIAIFSKLNLLWKYRAKKLDFCKCSFREMRKMVENIVADNPIDWYLPVVAIGHSKDFIYWKDLEKILDLIKCRYSDVIEIVPLTTAAKKYLNSRINLSATNHNP